MHSLKFCLISMSTALQRHLDSPSAIFVLRDIFPLSNQCSCRGYRCRTLSRVSTKRCGQENVKNTEHINGRGNGGLEMSTTSRGGHLAKDEVAHNLALYKARSYQLVAPKREQIEKKNLVSKPGKFARAAIRQPIWRPRLSTSEQYQRESDLEASNGNTSLLIQDKRFSTDWKLWLELVQYKKRHYEERGPQPLYREMFRRDLIIPTRGAVGKELWDTSIALAYHDFSFLQEVIDYAMKLKRISGEVWPRLYYSVVVCGLKVQPEIVYDLHVRLKDNFPPTLDQYKKLFHRSIAVGNLEIFENIYRNFPVQGMYGTIIPELCSLLKNQDALKWHYLLFSCRDYPSYFGHIKPLLGYLAHVGDDRQIDVIVRSLNLNQGQPASVPVAAEGFVRERQVISRAIFNRQLGEIHGVAPKHLSDRFCARLFATKLFSLETVISGLHIMAVETIGPLSLREIAVRADYCCSAIAAYIQRLKDAGISLDDSAFSLLVQKLVSSGDKDLLQSVAECDLHPDTFEDTDVQERLLAQYYDKDDQLQVDRTLAAIMVRCREQDVTKWRCNLTLRSYIKLGRVEAVKSILEYMRQNCIPVTARTSRHLRVCWLTGRGVGRAAHVTKELSIIINVTRHTLLSGRYVPIIAWREIMRRLGMAGRLLELENLALWLVDHYTSTAGLSSLPSYIFFNPEKVSKHRTTNRNPQAFLKTLFTTATQHAIVAWGFQQTTKYPPASFRRFQANAVNQPSSWTWGLVLLRNLQQRGVPIHSNTIASICTHRLNMLFGSGLSKNRINRRSRALDRYALAVYLQGIREIWGKDLFHNYERPKRRQLGCAWNNQRQLVDSEKHQAR